MNLGAVECSRKRCSGNGHCVETEGGTACVCSSPFSGESCQDHLNSVQGPIVYGAAGLCAAVVIIIVMAVVVKRRKNANTRFVFPLSRNLQKNINIYFVLQKSPYWGNMPVGGSKVYIYMPDII